MKIHQLKDGRRVIVTDIDRATMHVAVCLKCGAEVVERNTHQVDKTTCVTPSCGGETEVMWCRRFSGYKEIEK
ncbi:MAG: hypothetical protein ACPG77_14280 [Nannocystaceae bacterium]